VVYTVYGAALVCGIDLDAVIAEVHRANMSKLGPPFWSSWWPAKYHCRSGSHACPLRTGSHPRWTR
jgi:Phosphoribosyl-ATP pyrophosphohydrolase